jgi:hypothetical protein
LMAHSPRLFHRVRQLLIVHTPQSHLASFRESAVFAIPSCSSLSCSSCCSTSGLAATCLRNHPPVRRNRSICWGLLPPSSRQKCFLACSPVPSSSSTRPQRCQKTMVCTMYMYMYIYIYIHISKSDMCVVHVITDRYAATLPTSATATGTCLRNHPLVRSNRFICWAAPAKFSSEILPRLLSRQKYIRWYVLCIYIYIYIYIS